MPLIQYKRRRFSGPSADTIDTANVILREYEEQGFDLTLRQLYYQFVSRGLIPNSDREYKKLGSLVNDARLAGLIDWYHIVDRTRNLRALPSWDHPSDIIRGAANGFALDKWKTQETRLEVWIEKDALVGVIAGVCNRLDVPYFSCRGYTSQSEMWSAAQRHGRWLKGGQKMRILHLGDHDPSGIDMTRDIEDRLFLFIGSDHMDDQLREARRDGIHVSEASMTVMGEQSVQWTDANFGVDRLALNWAQIEEYDPPPNPAKLSDSRGASYVAEYGNESWELDALEPRVIAELIETAVLDFRDDDLWQIEVEKERADKDGLKMAAGRWGEVAAFLKGES